MATALPLPCAGTPPSPAPLAPRHRRGVGHGNTTVYLKRLGEGPASEGGSDPRPAAALDSQRSDGMPHVPSARDVPHCPLRPVLKRLPTGNLPFQMMERQSAKQPPGRVLRRGPVSGEPGRGSRGWAVVLKGGWGLKRARGTKKVRNSTKNSARQCENMQTVLKNSAKRHVKARKTGTKCGESWKGGSRQWPEVSDFVASFCTLRESKTHATRFRSLKRVCIRCWSGHTQTPPSGPVSVQSLNLFNFFKEFERPPFVGDHAELCLGAGPAGSAEGGRGGAGASSPSSLWEGPLEGERPPPLDGED